MCVSSDCWTTSLLQRRQVAVICGLLRESPPLTPTSPICCFNESLHAHAQAIAAITQRHNFCLRRSNVQEVRKRPNSSCTLQTHSSVNKQSVTPPPLSLHAHTLLRVFLSSPPILSAADKHTHTPSLTPPASHSLLTHTLKSYRARLSLLRGRQEQHGSLLQEFGEGAAVSERESE